MTPDQIEKLSRSNAKKVILGTDKLQSWGTTGWFKSQRLNRAWKFRSMLEANAMRALDEAELIVKDFDCEVFMIPYDWKGVTLNYVPDIVMKTFSDKVYVIEVKPSSQYNDAKNLAKWREAKRWCWERNARFFVIGEKDTKDLIQIIQHFEDKDIKAVRSLMEWAI